MTPRQPADRWLKLQDLTGRNGAASRPLLISDVRAALGLPEMPHAGFLNDECWLLGGSILRWLNGESNAGGPGGWDYDLFFPSREALVRSAGRFFAAGYKFSRYSIRGTPWDKITKKLWPPVPAFKRWDEGEGGECFRGICARPDLLVVELISPEGDLLQLAGMQTHPTIDQLLATIDYSVCQFVMDGRHLHAGPHAWGDLMNRRLRLQRMGYPPLAFFRLLKFARRGFRPDLQTTLTVTRSFARGRWRWPS